MRKADQADVGLRDQFGFENPAHIRANAQSLPPDRAADGVLVLIVVFLVALGDVLRKAKIGQAVIEEAEGG